MAPNGTIRCLPRLRILIARWIEIVYNPRRLQTILDYTSPVTFENTIKRDQAEIEEHTDQAQAA